MNQHTKQKLSALFLRRVALTCMVLGLILLIGYSQTSEGIEHKDLTDSDRSQAQYDLANHLNISISDKNAISLSVQNAAVNDIIEAINRKTDTDMIIVGSFEQQVNLAFYDLSLHDALMKVLSDHSYILYHIPNTTGFCETPEPELWIFSLNSEQPLPSNMNVEEDICTPQHVAATAFTPEKMTNTMATEKLEGSSVKELAKSLTAAVPEIREAAIYALAEVGGKTAVLALRPMINDDDSNVRDAAIEAFIEIGGDDSAKALAGALEHEDVDLREMAVEALAEIGGDTAKKALQKALQDSDSYIQETAAEYLEDF